MAPDTDDRGLCTLRTPFDLVIFDCDGVLVDSEPIANRILAEQLRSAGLHMPEEEVMRRFVGRTREGCLTLATGLLGRDLPRDFAPKWDAALFEALRNEVKAIDGVVELILSLSIPFCVASNGTRDRLRLTLETAGLLPLFEGRIYCARVRAATSSAAGYTFAARDRPEAGGDRGPASPRQRHRRARLRRKRRTAAQHDGARDALPVPTG